MNDFDNVRIARTLLRAALGLMYLAHSLWLKLVVFTLPGTAQFFESIGLPGLLAYGVFAAEAVGGALLLLGVRTREVAISRVPVLLRATWAHAGHGWVFSNAGGGFEYPLFLVVISIAVALLERPAPRSVPLASTRPV
jgi:putative oxidoreductase